MKECCNCSLVEGLFKKEKNSQATFSHFHNRSINLKHKSDYLARQTM